ncbi:SAP domain-containing ribonucleoprotein, partial [Lecanoromycetidae sp. Uapishka_2]
MSIDYTKKKNAELEDLLKARSLPHTGKKADLVARLQQYDTDQASAKPSTTTDEAGAEDEIDWEDDAAATTDPAGAAAIAAGGLVQPANPTAVPNQVVDTDPSKTSDLTVDPPTADPTKATTEATSAEPTGLDKAKVDYTAGLESTDLDNELAKRKARAAKFGIQESNEDALKALERAKKFGTGSEGDKVAVRGLDQALPERGVKRGRGGDGREEGRQGKRSKVRGGGRNEGRSGRERSRTPKDGVKKGTGGRDRGYTEADRAAAEKRKARFNAT